MGRTNKCDLKEDKSLAEEVRKLRCLYDKSCVEYQEKDRTANAWKEVDGELGYEEGKSINVLFHVL